MTTRGRMLVAAVCALVPTTVLSAASVRTTNFIVDAPNAEAAQQFGRYAEHYRKQKAMEWLGREMPPWREPCPLKVTVQMGGASGATEFDFGPNGAERQRMHIEGSYERLLNSVLPHEITHTVFAHYFRQPVPRWADEGGSVLSEDDTERSRHDGMCRQILNSGHGMRLRTLLPLKQYPNEVMVLYAQGFSVSRFLVEQADRATFLQFVAMGMQHDNGNWDAAVRQFYSLNNVEELEHAWIDSLRKPRPVPAGAIASRNPAPPADSPAAAAPAQVEASNRLVTRDTSVPALQFDAPQPVARGQIGTEGSRAAPPPPDRYRQPPPPPSPEVRLGDPEWARPPR